MQGFHEANEVGRDPSHNLNLGLSVFLPFLVSIIQNPPTREVTSKKAAFRILHNLVKAIALSLHSRMTRQVFHFSSAVGLMVSIESLCYSDP